MNATTDRLHQLLISSGITVTEACIEMETSPKLSPWAWFSGAHQQYHYALLLCMEIFAFPNLPDADRIWRCLDYVFEVPPHLTQERKSRWILTQVRDRTELFARSRKVRSPPGLGRELSQPSRRGSDECHDPPVSLGKMPRVNAFRADLSHNVAGAGAMRDPYMSLSEGPGIPAAQHYPTNMATQPAPVRHDRMVDIDWVSDAKPTTH